MGFRPQNESPKWIVIGFVAILGVVQSASTIGGKAAICHVDNFGNVKKLEVSQNALSDHLGHGDVYPGEELNGLVLNDDCMKVCEGIEITGGMDATAVLNGVHSQMAEISGRSSYAQLYAEGYIWWDPDQNYWLLGTGYEIDEVLARGSGSTPDTVATWGVLVYEFVSSTISSTCADGGSCQSIGISGGNGETAEFHGIYSYFMEYLGGRGAYEHDSEPYYMWWDLEQDLWVISTSEIADSAVARGSGGDTPDTVAAWEVRISKFEPSGISASCVDRQECPEFEGYESFKNLPINSMYGGGFTCRHPSDIYDCAVDCDHESECAAFSYYDEHCCRWTLEPSDFEETTEPSCTYIPGDIPGDMSYKKCSGIGITGATGATELNGVYSYDRASDGREAYILGPNVAQIEWDPELLLWVIKNRDNSASAHGSGESPDTVGAWKARDDSSGSYVASGISSSCYYKGDCQRPSDWCTDPGSTYASYDCDRDGFLDDVCFDADGNNGVRPSSNLCYDSWPNARVRDCPEIILTDRCSDIDITGATGATAVLNGAYSYENVFEGRYFYRGDSVYIWWDPEQVRWVIGTRRKNDDYVLARGSGGNTPDTVISWESRDNSALSYAPSDISSSCRNKEACQRPSDWCTGGSSTYASYDCDGDNLLDNVCFDADGNNGVRASSKFCEDNWPNARIDQCPEILLSGCVDIEITGATGASEVINGLYSYLLHYDDRAAYELGGGPAYIWWDSEQLLWVIGTAPADDNSVFARGDGDTPDTVGSWQSRDNREASYVSSGISSACYKEPEADIFKYIPTGSFGQSSSDNSGTTPFGSMGDGSSLNSQPFGKQASDNSKTTPFGSVGDVPVFNSQDFGKQSSDNSDTTPFGTIVAPKSYGFVKQSSDNSDATPFGSIGDGPALNSNGFEQSSSDNSGTSNFGSSVGDESATSKSFEPSSSVWSPGLRWSAAGVGLAFVFTLLIVMKRLARRHRGFAPIPSVSAV